MNYLDASVWQYIKEFVCFLSFRLSKKPIYYVQSFNQRASVPTFSLQICATLATAFVIRVLVFDNHN